MPNKAHVLLREKCDTCGFPIYEGQKVAVIAPGVAVPHPNIAAWLAVELDGKTPTLTVHRACGAPSVFME